MMPNTVDYDNRNSRTIFLFGRLAGGSAGPSMARWLGEALLRKFARTCLSVLNAKRFVLRLPCVLIVYILITCINFRGKH